MINTSSKPLDPALPASPSKLITADAGAPAALRRLLTCWLPQYTLSWLDELAVHAPGGRGEALMSAITQGLALLGVDPAGAAAQDGSPVLPDEAKTVSALSLRQPQPGSRLVACTVSAEAGAALALLASALAIEDAHARLRVAAEVAVGIAFRVAHPGAVPAPAAPSASARPPRPVTGAASEAPGAPMVAQPTLNGGTRLSARSAPAASATSGRESAASRAAQLSSTPVVGSRAASTASSLHTAPPPAHARQEPARSPSAAPAQPDRPAAPPPSRSRAGAAAGTEDAVKMATGDGEVLTPTMLRDERAALGISQAEAARLLGVSRGLLAEAERGRRSGPHTLSRLIGGLRLLRAKSDALAAGAATDGAAADTEAAEKPAPAEA